MQSGESVKEILWYWFPELISVALLVYVPPLVDMYLIAQLGSTTTLGALGIANNFLHVLIKFSEAIPAAAMVVIGRHNGAKEYKKCGQDLGDTFWITSIFGFIIFILLFIFSAHIYSWLGVPEKMVNIGVPFLRLRAAGIFLAFLLIAFLGFIRGIKNTHVPMMINIVGSIVFVVVDCVLVLGKLGFSKMRLTGSAIATILQFSVMIIISICYILWNPDYKKYFEKAFYMMFNLKGAVRLLRLSWPIMIDKTSLSFAYVWLFKMIAPMGKYAIGSMEIIKNLERLAFLPALAFARIILFLVSNRLGAKDFEGARNNIKKVILLATGMLAITLLTLCVNARFFIGFFDVKGKLSDFAAPILPVISLLVIFDLVQVILAGALRGAGDVRTVMFGRFLICFGFFVPLSYFFAHIFMGNIIIRFALVYSSFYLSNAVMGFVFLKRIRGTRWNKKSLD